MNKKLILSLIPVIAVVGLFAVKPASAVPGADGLTASRITPVGTYSDAAFAIGSVLGTLTIGSSVIRRMIRL